jgi:hypothetical protein
MNAHKQRIAIAQACGAKLWKNPTNFGPLELWSFDCPSPSSIFDRDRCDSFSLIPDYLNDLNAMHEAMSIFDYDQADEFDDHICDICKRANDIADNPAPWRFAVTNATATQRAEAFLRTLNLWKDEA